MARYAIPINIDLPPGVTLQELKRYMREAIETWGGQYHPDDPLFYSKFKLTFGPAQLINKRKVK